jgi:hypothetical protein
MQKEIHEQPKTLADTMRGRVVLVRVHGPRLVGLMGAS